MADIAGKWIEINNIPGPLGARGRNSDDRLNKEGLEHLVQLLDSSSAFRARREPQSRYVNAAPCTS